MKKWSTKNIVLCLVWLLVFPLAGALSAKPAGDAESLDGYYSRDGNSGSPSSTAGNNIYIKFFSDRWLAMLFVPYPYASGLQAKQINQVFEDAKKQTTSAAYLKGKFAGLTESVTLHFERYGYLENRIVFECGSLSPCTINTAEGYLNLIKPGVINEHIIKYSHIATP